MTTQQPKQLSDFLVIILRQEAIPTIDEFKALAESHFCKDISYLDITHHLCSVYMEIVTESRFQRCNNVNEQANALRELLASALQRTGVEDSVDTIHGLKWNVPDIRIGHLYSFVMSLLNGCDTSWCEDQIHPEKASDSALCRTHRHKDLHELPEFRKDAPTVICENYLCISSITASLLRWARTTASFSVRSAKVTLQPLFAEVLTDKEVLTVFSWVLEDLLVYPRFQLSDKIAKDVKVTIHDYWVISKAADKKSLSNLVHEPDSDAAADKITLSNYANTISTEMASLMKLCDIEWCKPLIFTPIAVQALEPTHLEGIEESGFTIPVNTTVIYMSELLITLLRWAKQEDYDPSLQSAKKALEKMYCKDMPNAVLCEHFCTAYSELLNEPKFQIGKDLGSLIASLTMASLEEISDEFNKPEMDRLIRVEQHFTKTIKHIASKLRNSNIGWCRQIVYPDMYDNVEAMARAKTNENAIRGLKTLESVLVKYALNWRY